MQVGFHYKEGELFCDSVCIRDILKDLHTPLYIYSANKIKEQFTLFKKAFPDALICYAYKANPTLAIIKFLQGLGAGAEVISGGELFRAIKVGTPPENIVFNGNGKTKEELLYAIDLGILMINIDSEPEFELLQKLAKERKKKVKVAFRVNPVVESYNIHPHLSTATAYSKFGLSMENAYQLYKSAKDSQFLQPIGVHMHIGSQITTIVPFVQAIDKMLKFICDLKAAGIPIQWFNIGGGLGVSYNGKPVATSQELANAILPQIEKLKIKLIIEPGRSIVAEAGILLMEVLYVKQSMGKNFVIVDAGMNDFIRTPLYNAKHTIKPIKITSDKTIVADIVGPICEEADYFARNYNIAQVNEGDYLALFCAGAYGMSMASNYPSRPRPAEVMVCDTEYRLIRQAESYQDLILRECL